jgi:hypothetical protein
MNFTPRTLVVALLTTLLSNVLQAANMPELNRASIAATPKSFFTTQTATTVLSPKPRYQRGEVIRIQVEAWQVRYDAVGSGWRVVRIAPAPNQRINISEKSTRGTVVIGTAQSDRLGRVSISYRVPLDPRTDNVRVCGWAMNEEPFEGAEVRIPIGK